MIRKYAGEIEMVCDTCGQEGPSYDEGDFERMVAEAKVDRWSITRPDGVWQHECPSCASHGSALAQARRKFGIR